MLILVKAYTARIYWVGGFSGLLGISLEYGNVSGYVMDYILCNDAVGLDQNLMIEAHGIQA